jgi:hypothetical protein
MLKILKRLSSTVASLFSIMLNCEILLFLLFSLNDPKMYILKNTLLLNQARYHAIQSPLQFTNVFVYSDFSGKNQS